MGAWFQLGPAIVPEGRPPVAHSLHKKPDRREADRRAMQSGGTPARAQWAARASRLFASAEGATVRQTRPERILKPVTLHRVAGVASGARGRGGRVAPDTERSEVFKRGFFRSGAELILGFFRSGAELLRGFFRSGAELILGFFRSGAELILGFFRSGAELIRGFFRSGAELIRGFFRSGAELILGFYLGRSGAGFFSWGGEIWEFFIASERGGTFNVSHGSILVFFRAAPGCYLVF